MLLLGLVYRGAVRPPFIEVIVGFASWSSPPAIGGQSAPPSLKCSAASAMARASASYRGAVRPPFIEVGSGSGGGWGSSRLSGGSPPPLH